MAKAIRDYTKKNRAQQAGVMVGVRLQPGQLARLDAWIAQLPDPKPSRPEGIRRALEAVIRLSEQDDEAE